jgi:hypothetical protein
LSTMWNSYVLCTFHICVSNEWMQNLFFFFVDALHLCRPPADCGIASIHLLMYDRICMYLIMYDRTCMYLIMYDRTCMYLLMYDRTCMYLLMYDRTCMYLLMYDCTCKP